MRIHVPRLAIDQLARDVGLPRPQYLRAPVFKIVRDSVLFHFAMAVLPAVEAPAEASSLFLDHVARASVAHIHRAYLGGSAELPGHRGGLAPWQERRAKDLLTARLDRRLSIAELARECRLSSSHFARAFRQATGLPPHRWFLQYRVERAKALLRGGDTPLEDIASACGFKSQPHLTRVFSRHVGESPGAWRRARKT
jgi:AraC-like DNA-binding protein